MYSRSSFFKKLLDSGGVTLDEFEANKAAVVGSSNRYKTWPFIRLENLKTLKNIENNLKIFKRVFSRVLF